MPTLQEQLQETAKVMRKSAESSARIIAMLIDMKLQIERVNDVSAKNDLSEVFRFLNAEINTSSQHTQTALEMYNNIIDKMAAELFKMQEGMDE